MVDIMSYYTRWVPRLVDTRRVTTLLLCKGTANFEWVVSKSPDRSFRSHRRAYQVLRPFSSWLLFFRGIWNIMFTRQNLLYFRRRKVLIWWTELRRKIIVYNHACENACVQPYINQKVTGKYYTRLAHYHVVEGKQFENLLYLRPL